MASVRAAGILGLCVGLALACAPAQPDRYQAPAWPAAREVHLSLLAVGDTGKAPFLSHRLHKQLRVGLGLAAEDRYLPVDALVLLGDNFYWDGLQRHELAERVRDNVVRPFCHFVELDGPRSSEVREACDDRAGRSPSVPLHVVLGNHDYESPESPALQREVVPEFVPNWRVPASIAETVEFDAGLSLILLDSMALQDGSDPGSLREALSASRGPWRVVAAHHPIAWVRDRKGTATAVQRLYRERVMDVLNEVGVFVHLFLGGHEHNLQVVSMPSPGPPLHVVAGSGSRVRRPKTSNPDARFVLGKLGFVRIDLVGHGDGQRMLVSVFSTPGISLFPTATRKLESRWAVTRDGTVREIPLLPSDRAAYGAVFSTVAPSFR